VYPRWSQRMHRVTGLSIATFCTTWTQACFVSCRSF